jgi:hypothetical protein
MLLFSSNPIGGLVGRFGLAVEPVDLGLEAWVSAWRWWSRADLDLEAWVSTWRWWSRADLGLEARVSAWSVSPESIGRREM